MNMPSKSVQSGEVASAVLYLARSFPALGAALDYEIPGGR